MRDFVYFNPVNVIFGRDKVNRIGEVSGRYGKKALIVYGRESIKKSGLYDLVKEKLKAEGIDAVDHGGVKPNPVLSHVREGVKKAKEGFIEVILAIGGGSVMDEAKAIAAGAVAECDVWDFFSKGVKPQTALPVITVPTLAATGSEMNGNMVVTNEITLEKLATYSPECFPKTSLLDPALTITVPKHQTAYGIADIFSHLLEPYFNGSDGGVQVQDHIAESLFFSLLESAEKIFGDLKDYQARAEILWISSLALCGLPAMGRGKVRFENHFIAHSLSALFDVPHGAALSVVMPGWMQWSIKRDTKKFARFAVKVMGVEKGDEAATARKGVAKTKEWLKALKVPVTLGEVGVTESDFPKMIKNILPVAKSAGYDDLTEDSLKEILKLCL